MDRNAAALKPPRPFLTAEWRHLLMAQYEVDPAILAPHVPAGTELDLWEGRAVVSMVGFRFLNTRVLGVPIPFHRDFDEVNLRFYVVRRMPNGDVRRGAVFVREIVPLPAITVVARVLYNEPYITRPMRSQTSVENGLIYEWRNRGHWDRLSAGAVGEATPMTPGSEAHFIYEHYYGYTVQRNGGVKEYRLEHPPWSVRQVRDVRFECDVAALYGKQWEPFLTRSAVSVFVADGSPVRVFPGVRLP